MNSDNTTGTVGPLENSVSRRTRLAICFLIFLTAFGVRLLSWHDTRLEVGKVQTVVTADYQRVARLIKEGGIAGFLSSSSPLSDLNTLGHPPGYSIVMALIFSVFDESNTAVQFVQILGDAFAAVIICLIVAELLPVSAALIAGMLAALSPQFAWNSVLLLPDSLAVLPILLAVYCLTRPAKNPRLVTFILAGALVGISCWLRANAMLLTFFLAAAVPILLKKQVAKCPTNLSLSLPGKRDKLKFVGQRLSYALAVILGTLVIVMPLTIRNAIVFHRFIPLSLGAGQTLLEGIADYDPQGRFNIPSTDMGIMKQEAQDFQRPDYYGTLFNPDGVERERARLERGWAVIRAHPLWFSGVMARRAGSMLRLERSRLVSTGPPVSHSLDATTNPQSVWLGLPTELLTGDAIVSHQAKAILTPNGEALVLTGDSEKYGEQFLSAPVPVKQNNDYVLTAPIKIEQGRMKISVKDLSGRVYSSAIVETLETKSPAEQPLSPIQLPFVVTHDDQVRIVLSNEASNPPNPTVQIGPIALRELGPARYLWTRYPRLLVHAVQRLFLTAVILPLALIGLGLLIVRKHGRALIILSVIPVYFFCVQSIVHTEYRYVLAVDYFLFALAALAISRLTRLVMARYSVLGARTPRPH